MGHTLKEDMKGKKKLFNSPHLTKMHGPIADWTSFNPVLPDGGVTSLFQQHMWPHQIGRRKSNIWNKQTPKKVNIRMSGTPPLEMHLINNSRWMEVRIYKCLTPVPKECLGH